MAMTIPQNTEDGIDFANLSRVDDALIQSNHLAKRLNVERLQGDVLALDGFNLVGMYGQSVHAFNLRQVPRYRNGNPKAIS